MKKKIIFLVIIFLGLISVTLIGVGFNKTKLETAKLMPKGYNDVYLGMSRRELKRIKPDLKWNDSTRSYYQEIDNEFYRLVSFEFSYSNFLSHPSFPFFTPKKLVSFWFNRNRLVTVQFIGSPDPDYVKTHLDGFLAGCTKKWGTGYEKKLWMYPPEIYKASVLYWKKGGTNIVVSYPPKTINAALARNKQDMMEDFIVTIYDPNLSPYSQIISDVVKDPNKQKSEIYFKDIPSLIQSVSPIFE